MMTYLGTARSCARKKGFTLIEVLIVLGIIAVLAAVVLVAINPARQFAQARNTQRESNVTTILDAIDQRTIDGQGTFAGTFSDGSNAVTCPSLDDIPTGIPQTIGIGDAGAVDLSCLVPTYIPGQLPFDPSVPGAHWNGADDYETAYSLIKDADGRIEIVAAGAELGAVIHAKR